MKYGSAIIIRLGSAVLLQLRDNNAPTDKNKWALWGGGKEGDETPAQTAVRELSEELMILVDESQLRLYKTIIVTFENGASKKVTVFELHDEGNFDFILKEGEDLQFFQLKDVPRLPLDAVAKVVFEDYCRDVS